MKKNAKNTNDNELTMNPQEAENQKLSVIKSNDPSSRQKRPAETSTGVSDKNVEEVADDGRVITAYDDGNNSDDSDEEIITSAMPPKQIVDTIVTTTTNPDGSLKRTTRKTTRTVLTTARIRKIKMTNLPPDGELLKPPVPSSSNDLNMSNVINFTKLNSDKSDGNSLAQATLAIIPPQTEVTYQENVKPISDIDPDFMAKLQKVNNASSEQSSDNVASQKAITKTTMKKTVTATAATATFYATGTDARSQNLFQRSGSSNEKILNNGNNSRLQIDPEHSADASSRDEKRMNSATQVAAVKRMNKSSPTKRKNRDSLTTTTTTTTTTTQGESSTTTTTTTTTRKHTTRVINNFASKGFFFTFKKPFSLFGKEMPAENENSQSTTDINMNKNGIVDTEQLALMAMKESERMFSQAKLMFPSNQNLMVDENSERSGSQFNSENDGNARNDEGVVQGYQSRFANLPLYQGYGIIAHQMALSNKAKAGKEFDQNKGAHHDENEEDRTTSEVDKNTTDIQPISDQSGTDISLVANTFAHLLDESILKFLYEATSQQLGRSGSLNLFELPAYIEGPLQNKQISYSDSADDAAVHQENICNTPLDLVSPEVNDYKRLSKDGKVGEDVKIKMLQANDLKRVQGDENASESLCQKTSKFGVGTQGAFRVAWSDMPEVIESTCLQRLTRHEIQLQEAMFEVITSEASYYQSLNVLVNHFYHAPEFECEPLNHTSVQTNQVPNKVCKDPGSPMSCGVGQQDFISFSSQTTTDPNAASATTGTVTNNASSNTANNTTANSNNADSSDFCLDTGNQTPACNTRRPLLKPLEKHHLFSNVLLVCLASEMFLRDLEARWESRMPILNEVCDLIVKHAGGVNFEPYITYLRNQTYQMATLRKLCKRDSFRAALENLHAHPRSGKNLITSFLALPMQRLTRLKLLVEVIRRLQDAVIRDSMDKTLEKRPFRVPSDRERENVQLALRELNRLLTASETEKELMDRKSRLLTLSSSLEFPDNVKRIAISDKRLIKEGELRENFSDSVRLSVLQKLAIRKPNLFYLILFNDLLLVTRKKKNERFLVLDYCDRASVQAFVQRNGDLIGTSTNLLKNPKNSISAEPLCIIEPCTDDIQLNTQKTKRFLSPDSEDTSKNLKCTAKDKRHRRHKTTNDFDDLITPKTSDSNNDNNNGVRTEPSRVQSYVETSKNVETSKVSNTDGIPTSITPATTSNNLTGLPSATTTTTAATSVTTTPTTVFMSSATSTKKINLSRSGSSLSGYHLRFNHERIRNIKSNIFSTPQSNMNALVNCKTGTIHLKLLGSHNGTCSELVLLPKDDREFESWCKAFSLSLDSPY